MIRSSLLFGVAFAILGWATARAEFITTLTASETPQPGGLTLYQYTLTNDPTSTLNAEGLAISVDANADLQSITGPTGWDISYLPGDTLVTWESSDISIQFIAPGDSAAFSFLSALGPAQQPYLVIGTDTLGIDFDSNFGDIASPAISSVPEPGSLVLSGLGALGVLAMVARRYPRSRP